MLGIVCQLCAKRPATSHLTELDPLSGSRTELHICATCIIQLELSLTSDPPPIAEVLAKYAALSDAPTITLDESTDLEANSATCPSCGLSFAEFASHNRFGCGQCYTAFARQVEPLLARYHGAAEHTGRVPATAARAPHDDLVAKRLRLDRALREAISAEDYGQAARLRDQLHALDESA